MNKKFNELNNRFELIQIYGNLIAECILKKRYKEAKYYTLLYKSLKKNIDKKTFYLFNQIELN